MSRLRRAAAVLMAGALGACTSALQPMGPPVQTPVWSETGFTASDGVTLPVRQWLPDDATPWAMVLAVHGMNDYSHAFEDFGRALAVEGAAVYAYDQRGFGASPRPGIWAGWPTMASDLREAAGALWRNHPGVPLFILGESMGGAVAMIAVTDGGMPPLAGMILSAPGVWSRTDLGRFPRAMLWLFNGLTPGLILEGKGLEIWPSDNIEMLRALSRDPLVIKGTRVDAIAGLMDLMDEASLRAKSLPSGTLVLYGEKDQIIPAMAFWRAFPDGTPIRLALYPKGWHMLLRDLQAPIVWDDVSAWMRNPAQPLPSEADRTKKPNGQDPQ